MANSDVLTKPEFQGDRDPSSSTCSLWRVPATGDGPFGEHLQTGMNRLIVLYRECHGWRAGEAGNAFVRLGHQVYKANLEEILKLGPYEIVAVDLDRGEWLTLWARGDSDVSYPMNTQTKRGCRASACFRSPWAQRFKRHCPTAYREALRRVGEPVVIYETDETGERQWAVALEDDFWMDGFPTKEEAEALVSEMGWEILGENT